MSKKNSQSRTFKRLGIIFAVVAVVVAWAYSCDAKTKKQVALPASQTDAVALQQVRMPQNSVSEILQYPGFTVSFNRQHHQPNWVAWELTGRETQGTLPRYNKFAEDESVLGSAVPADYRRSGYDRGHMAPAADMKWSHASMVSCFYLTNICPQAGSLNSGAWKSLEERCRNWAQRDSAIIIVCGPILTDRLTQTIGQSRVSVPQRFFKVVLAPFANPPRAIGFIMPNGHVDGGMQQSAVSVDEVERITGFDFFAALPDEVEDIVEAQCNFPLWQRSIRR